ncbi:uncharacterized protein LOC131262897 isoform X2 [Anopheles coustani]|nr:uncharacterized protein LOC131262897 isoform X2 [Anopheles coustani]
MTEYDAAAALLLLSAGSRSVSKAESNNNSMAGKRGVQKNPSLVTVDLTTSPSSTQSLLKAPKTVKLRTEDLVRLRARQKTLRVIQDDETENVNRSLLSVPQQPNSRRSSLPSAKSEKMVRGKMEHSTMEDLERLGSSSPPDPVQRWDTSRTSSPIVVSSSGLPSHEFTHSTHDSYDAHRRDGITMYDSPGMKGFALQLNSKVVERYDTSSPELEPATVQMRMLPMGGRKRRRSNGEEKSLNSPTDSGVSSIHDEILQPNFTVRPWRQGLSLGDGLPALVRTEMKKIVELSILKKEQYTETKMAEFPMEFGFNPNKSRIRKECSDPADIRDRERNNEASRRSRHKKKIMTQILSIGLEFDRNENRQLFLQDRWLSDMICELEEKALNLGKDAQVLRKLRSDCGFQ